MLMYTSLSLFSFVPTPFFVSFWQNVISPTLVSNSHIPKDDFELLTRPFQMLRVQACATTPDQIHFYCVNIVVLKVEISDN